MPKYLRAFVPGGCYFFTVVLADRASDLLVSHVDHLRAAFRHVQRNHPFEIVAAVVMPDHLHAVWTLPDGDADFSTRWGLIKGQFSRALPANEARSRSRIAKRERGIWQRRGWEHLIRNEDDFARHLDYIHFNPVKHGYVKSPADWAHSSFARLVKQGWYPPDWAADATVREMEFE